MTALVCLASASAAQGGLVIPDADNTPPIRDAETDFGRYYALLIGIQDYKHEDGPWKDLTTPVNDVTKLRAVLEERFGFEGVVLLTDAFATGTRILQSFDDLRHYSQDDNVLIYFAGHGWQREEELEIEGSREKARKLETYWIPHDGSKDPSTWVSGSQIRDRLRKLRAKHVLLISDSCYSGGLYRTGGLEITNREKEAARLQSCQIFTSGGTAPVPDTAGDDASHSLFAKYLIKNLKSARRILLASKLHDYVTEDVTRDSTQFRAQMPLLGAFYDRDAGGQFIFHFRGEALSPAGSQREASVAWPANYYQPSHVVDVRGEPGVFRVKGVDECEMVLVEGGNYEDPLRNGETRRIHSFLMDRYEVSIERFDRFLKSRKRQPELPYWGHPGYSDPGQPVVGVSLELAREFAEWAGKRLPSEAQWHYAAAWDKETRKATPYPWGDEFVGDRIVRRLYPPPVQATTKGRWELFGLGFGVREWCELEPPDPLRGVIRGGASVLSGRRERPDTKLSDRVPARATESRSNLGFRCIYPLDPE